METLVSSDTDVELKRLHRILNSVSPPVCYLDRDLRYVYLNEAYLRWFSCAASEVCGQHLSTVIGDVAFEYCRPHLERALRGERVMFEAHLPCGDGQMRFVRAEMIPDHGENGKVQGVIGIVTDLHESKGLEDALREAMARVEAQSLQDSLTGLGNHRAFQERLGEAERAFERDKTPCALLFFDVDSFKSYNDSFGHPAGDEVLRHVAALLKTEIRPGDLVARYGGEEFAVLLRGVGSMEAQQCAERLRQSIENASWSLRPVTVSGGVAEFSALSPCGALVLQRADEALYCAKTSGKNRVCVSAPQSARSSAIEVLFGSTSTGDDSLMGESPLLPELRHFAG